MRQETAGVQVRLQYHLAIFAFDQFAINRDLGHRVADDTGDRAKFHQAWSKLEAALPSTKMPTAFRWTKIMLKLHWLVAAFTAINAVALGTPIPIAGSNQPPIPLLDQVMAHFVQKISCTAGTLAISKGDRLVYQRAYGWLDRERIIPAPLDTCIGLASCEKPITSAAIRKLAGEGDFSMDSPLFQTLRIHPMLPVVDRRVYNITFEYVLNNTAGWGGDIHDDLVRAARAAGETPPFTIPMLLGAVMSRPLKNEPGKVDDYSNFGFDAMRYAVQFMSHKTPGLYYRQLLLHKNDCKEIGQPEELLPGQTIYPVVWNLSDGGPIFASAKYLCDFMDEYWYTGKPRDNDNPLWVKYGSLPGSTAVMIWRQDGYNIAAVFNGRNQTTNDEVRYVLDDAVELNISRLQVKN
jgi:hypothetical protein